jgi:hypothetical protein
MNGEHLQDELIELGVASIETKGGPIGFEDSEATLRVKTGLTDD